MRRARIVATLGPALDDPEILHSAISAGIDVVRLNFSHGKPAEHRERLDRVRAISDDIGRTLGSIGDLQGPKIRLGDLPGGGIELQDGEPVFLIAGKPALNSYETSDHEPRLPVVYEQIANDVVPGNMILMDDGLLRLVVDEVEGDTIRATVITGGTAKSRKGVNLPGSEVSAKALTEKDAADIETMVGLELDWIALSFVRQARDIEEARARIKECGGDQPIIAKLERPEAVANLEEIIDAADAVMVARGDLGVEIGPERVPELQKRIIDLANAEAKPVITATEMLDSMIRSPRPTRAEASDVANAILDGTDAVMLSGETAAGRYPVEAVRTMARIVESAEATDSRYHTPPPPIPDDASLTRVVAAASVRVAEQVAATAIVVFSNSGRSVQLVTKARPTMQVIGLTTNERSLKRMALMWGVRGGVVSDYTSSRELIALAEETCLRRGFAERGDTVVVVSGIPGYTSGTNRLMVHQLGDDIDN